MRLNFIRRARTKMKSVLSLQIIVLFTAIFFWATPLPAQGIIYVTSLEDKISGEGGCSLKEAIYSANFDDNVAIDEYGEFNHLPHFVTTQCAPGRGADTIVLPTGATFDLKLVTQDATNPTGPAALPLITTNITIEAAGSTLQFAPNPTFPCTFFTVPYPCVYSLRLFAIASSGHLRLNNANVKGFLVHGGNGGWNGGGGGMGAGGAVFVRAGTLEVMNSTFSGNGAIGGDAMTLDNDPGGGGGGLAGWGGPGSCAFGGLEGAGNGGGGGGSFGFGTGSCIGDGGGTLFSANDGPGFDCGGAGATAEPAGTGVLNGQDGQCPGGGGGGGSNDLTGSGNGGKGAYGGGGGGGGALGGNGGDGGFGGGGGSGWTGFFGGTRGGTGGFGGGGGAVQDGTVGGGHPGVGGAFGGDAKKFNGGGGAGLGGAIFNDSGSVFVQDSTFNGNFATRGNGDTAGAGGAADNGADAGAAIFSYHGSTTLQHVTISGNETTGSGGGVYIYQDPNLQAPTSLSIYNSIIAKNGAGLAAPNECVVSGSSVTTDGSGNLILDNGSCPGVVSGSDPNLGPLQNNGGLTPTMAIPKSSPAFNAADPFHATNRDQRNIFRPQVGAPDIGAFELCVAANPLFPPCEVPTVINPDPLALLTMVATPLTGGTTNPSPGIHPVPLDSVSVIRAIPTAGNTFLGWLGTVTDPTNPLTTVIMDHDQTVTAQFSGLTTTISGNITGKSGPANARDWTLSLTNSGPAGADAIIPSFTLAQTFGANCTPHIGGAFPLTVPTLSAGQTGSADVLIDFTGCAANARFTATFTFSANNGTVTGNVVRTNQFE
jgi:hypothetical protein